MNYTIVCWHIEYKSLHVLNWVQRVEGEKPQDLGVTRERDISVTSMSHFLPPT